MACPPFARRSKLHPNGCKGREALMKADRAQHVRPFRPENCNASHVSRQNHSQKLQCKPRTPVFTFASWAGQGPRRPGLLYTSLADSKILNFQASCVHHVETGSLVHNTIGPQVRTQRIIETQVNLYRQSST